MSYQMLLAEQDVTIEIVERRPVLKIKNGDAVRTVLETSGPGGAFTVTVDGRSYSGWRCTVGDEVHLRMDGRTFIIGLPQAQLRAHVHSKGDDEIHADMPGTMIAIHAEAGAKVAAGDKLVTIESMKLQVSLVAPRDGVVDKVHVPAETAFERGALLVSLVPLVQETEAPAQGEASK
jgi:3-methylcrotonyl-CoA carboxylase alpha subunit